jgi:lysozyme family protein
MDANFPTIAKGTELHEGLYSIVRSDDGNWTGGKVGVGMLAGTMRGISAATMAHWQGPGRPVTAAVMKSITLDMFLAIARSLYWRPLNGAALPSGLDLMTFDFGFNAGVATAAKMLQGMIHADTDGDIGPETLAAIGLVEQSNAIGGLILALAAAQKSYYRSLKGFAVFGDGWLARVDWRMRAALALARGDETVPLA